MGKETIRLAILGTRGIPARYGGFETFADQLSSRLACRGIDVTVVCPAESDRSDDSINGVRRRYVKFPKLGKYSQMAWDAKCFTATRHGFDVVYMLGVGGAYAAWIPRIFGTRVWINPDGLEWKRSKFTWPQRAYLRVVEGLSVLFATRLIADAGAMATYLRRRYPGRRRISTIAYGADVADGEPESQLIGEWGLTPGDYSIVVCRLEPENHVLEIIEGYERSLSPFPLVILGDTENPNAYVLQLLTHRSARIRFLGTVFDREKLTALRFHARAYIHGHSVGGTNPSLLEAMACSNLVIAHDNAFNREVLGDSGVFFTAREDLAGLINQVDDGNLDAKMRGQLAAQRVREIYQWDQVADAYENLLRSHT